MEKIDNLSTKILSEFCQAAKFCPSENPNELHSKIYHERISELQNYWTQLYNSKNSDILAYSNEILKAISLEQIQYKVFFARDYEKIERITNLWSKK